MSAPPFNAWNFAQSSCAIPNSGCSRYHSGSREYDMDCRMDLARTSRLQVPRASLASYTKTKGTCELFQSLAKTVIAICFMSWRLFATQPRFNFQSHAPQRSRVRWTGTLPTVRDIVSRGPPTGQRIGRHGGDRCGCRNATTMRLPQTSIEFQSGGVSMYRDTWPVGRAGCADPRISGQMTVRGDRRVA